MAFGPYGLHSQILIYEIVIASETKPCLERREGTLEIATPACRNTCLHGAFQRRQTLACSSHLSVLAMTE